MTLELGGVLVQTEICFLFSLLCDDWFKLPEPVGFRPVEEGKHDTDRGSVVLQRE